MPRAKRYKAQAFDKMQYFYRKAHEPLIHCLIKLAGQINEALLSKAVSVSTDAIPMIRCVFDPKKHIWRDAGFTGKDIVHLVNVSSQLDGTIQRLLAQSIDIFTEPQLKIIIARDTHADTLCILMNHMVCDGAGFKEYLYLLAEIYAKCKNGTPMPDLTCGPRSALQLFKRFSLPEKLKILRLKHDLSAQKEQEPFVFEGDADRPFFSTLEIPAEQIASVRAYARTHGATVNDMFLTAYARVLHNETGWNRIILPCPVDLRKHLMPGQQYGICNLTSNFICDIPVNGGDDFLRTLHQISSQMAAQKDSLNCLKSQMTLELFSRLVPFRVMERVFHKAFKIPLVSYSNLGMLDDVILNFGDIEEAYLTGAVKPVPYFQAAVSTFRGRATLSCNMIGTPDDQSRAERILRQIRDEIISALKII